MHTFLRKPMHSVRTAVALALVLACLPPVMASGATKAPALKSRYAQRPDHAVTGVAGPTRLMEPKRVVVRWASGVRRDQVRAAARKVGFKVLRESSKLGWALVEPVKDGLTPEELAGTLTKSRLAMRARVERVFRPMQAPPPTLPDDPLFPDQWALDNTGQTGGLDDADIDAPEAWASHGTGSRDVVVAVVDTGVYIGHDDLKDNIWRNPGEIPGNGRDDDRNGYIDDINGYDFFWYDASVYDPEDGDQHGTHVAGIIGALGNNGRGIAGVNHEVTIMPVKFLGPWGGGEYEGAEAIIYAVDNGADVINCSWGGPQSEVIEQALRYAAERGVVVAAAAGNDRADVDENPQWYYPASSDATCVITVASTDHNDDLSWFSNYGDDMVELAAPGEEVLSTLPYESVGVYVDAVPFKVAYLAFCLEAIEPVSAAQQALVTSLQRLGARSSTRILVVDDSMPSAMGEIPGERLSFYTDALVDAGYTSISTWSTESKGSPPASALQGKVVIWFTGAVPSGWYDANTLDKKDRAALRAYLDSGGRLLLASGEAGADVYWVDEDFLYSYLHAYPTDWSTWGFSLRGRPGTAFAGISGALKPEYTSWFDGLWPTGSDPIRPADEKASVIFEMGGYGPLSGTSMAAPHVAGAAAHVLAASPDLPAEEVKARIENTVDLLPSLAGKVGSGGRLNLSRAFDAYPGRPVIVAPKAGDVLRAGTTAQLRWKPAAGGSVEATFEAEIGLPQVEWSDGFEDGDVHGWDVVEGAAWEATTTAYTGSYAMSSPELDPDEVAAVQTTVTVPEGGGTVSFWCKASDGVYGIALLGDMQWVEIPSGSGWNKCEGALPEGEQTIIFSAYRDAALADTDEDCLLIDDVTLQTHRYEALGTAGAGETSLDFIVPDVSTRDARFRLRANLDGVSSGWSYVRRVRISTDFTAPGSPTAFSAVAGDDGDAMLSWTDPTDPDFDYTRILRRFDGYPTSPEDEEAVVVYEGKDGEFHDVGMPDGTHAYYAAFAVDEELNWSDGAFTDVEISDQIAPDPVDFLEARMMDGAVVLSWMSPPSWQCAGVRVLRRTDTTPTAFDDPKATCVFDGCGASAWDYDVMLEPDGTRAYYAVYAYDASGNTSDASTTSIVIDTTAPVGTISFEGLEPQESVLSGEEMYFTASRDVTLVSDVTGADEMRFHQGDDWTDWESFAPTKEMTLLDVDGPTLLSAWYRDEAGNVLDLYATVYYDKKVPDAPMGLMAFNHNYGARLVWDVPDDESVVGWNVYFATNASGPWTKATQDGLAIEPEYVVGRLQPGVKHFFKVTAVDGVDHESAASDIVSTTPDEGVVRRSGADRYKTAIEVSKSAFDSADTVVLVSGASYADAVSASALAGAYDAPILLTEPTRLTRGVATEIARLGASRVIIVGGTGAVSDAVKNALPAGLTVERVWGRDRFETSVRAAQRVKAKMGDAFCGEVFVANGYSFADPLAVSSVAWKHKMPVLLVRTYEAPPSVASFVADNVSDLYVVGGVGVVAEWVPEDLGFPDAERLAGMNRYETAAAVAEFAAEAGWASFVRVGIASGRNFPDALAGGPAIGKAGGVLLLTDPAQLSEATENSLFMHIGEIDKIEIFGGPGAVSDDVAAYLIDMMQGGF